MSYQSCAKMNNYIDFKNCCRLCLKCGENAMVNCVIITELNIVIETLFSFVIRGTDQCSTKICQDCSFKITNMSMFRDTVIANQKTINQYQKIQSKIMGSFTKTESDGIYEDDDVCFINDNLDEPIRLVPIEVEEKPNNFNDQNLVVGCSEASTILKSETECLTTKFKATARKSTAKKQPTANQTSHKKIKNCKIVLEHIQDDFLEKIITSETPKEIPSTSKTKYDKESKQQKPNNLTSNNTQNKLIKPNQSSIPNTPTEQKTDSVKLHSSADEVTDVNNIKTSSEAQESEQIANNVLSENSEQNKLDANQQVQQNKNENNIHPKPKSIKMNNEPNIKFVISKKNNQNYIKYCTVSTESEKGNCENLNTSNKTIKETEIINKTLSEKEPSKRKSIDKASNQYNEECNKNEYKSTHKNVNDFQVNDAYSEQNEPVTKKIRIDLQNEIENKEKTVNSNQSSSSLNVKESNQILVIKKVSSTSAETSLKITLPSSSFVKNNLEKSKQSEISKLSENSNRSETPKKSENSKQLENSKQSEMSKKLENSKQLEMSKKSENSKQSETSKKSENSKQLEMSKKLENSKQSEMSKKLENSKQLEMSKKSENSKQLEMSKKLENSKQLEMSKKSENSKQSKNDNTEIVHSKNLSQSKDDLMESKIHSKNGVIENTNLSNSLESTNNIKKKTKNDSQFNSSTTDQKDSENINIQSHDSNEKLQNSNKNVLSTNDTGVVNFEDNILDDVEIICADKYDDNDVEIICADNFPLPIYENTKEKSRTILDQSSVKTTENNIQTLVANAQEINFDKIGEIVSRIKLNLNAFTTERAVPFNNKIKTPPNTSPNISKIAALKSSTNTLPSKPCPMVLINSAQYMDTLADKSKQTSPSKLYLSNPISAAPKIYKLPIPNANASKRSKTTPPSASVSKHPQPQQMQYRQQSQPYSSFQLKKHIPVTQTKISQSVQPQLQQRVAPPHQANYYHNTNTTSAQQFRVVPQNNQTNLNNSSDRFPLLSCSTQEDDMINYAALPTCNDQKFKILSVKELNMKAEESMKKLPIRISLVRVKNELQIKLMDSRNIDIDFDELTKKEQLAIRNSLTQPSSKTHIFTALKYCQPDENSRKILKCFGII